MSSLVIKNLPKHIHYQLKKQAARHHRSMTGEAIVILSEGLGKNALQETPAPYKGKFPLTGEFTDRAKRAGRA